MLPLESNGLRTELHFLIYYIYKFNGELLAQSNWIKSWIEQQWSIEYFCNALEYFEYFIVSKDQI